MIGGVNGLAPNWQHMIDLETNVATANADVGAMGYLTNARVRGRLKSTSKVTGQNGFIWENGTTPVNGYSAAVTNAVPSNLTRGTGTNLSAIIFGNFSDLVIGMWGGMDWRWTNPNAHKAWKMLDAARAVEPSTGTSEVECQRKSSLGT